MSAAKATKSRNADRLARLPPAVVQLVSSAAAALQRNHAMAAEQGLLAALAQAPEHPEVLRLLGMALRLQNRNSEALAVLQRAAKKRPDDALIQNGLGSALDACGDHENAIKAFRRAADLAPQAAQIWSNLGKTLGDHGYFEEALTVLRRAAAMTDHPATQLRLAYALRVRGHIDEAAQHFRELIARNPSDGGAWQGLSGLKSLRFSQADIAAMQRALQDPNLKPGERISLGFSLAKAYDDHARYPEAFAAYTQANAQTRKLHPWDGAAFSAYIDRVLAHHAQPLPGATGALGSEIIFIVSLPRSGSSLTEQILASHPRIEGAGELNDMSSVLLHESDRRQQPYPEWVAAATPNDWQRLGMEYLERTTRWRKPGMLITDKMPNNWIRVGSIMAMLPGARVIDCRRDPVESCFSCFRTLFSEGNQPFAYAIEDMAGYWHEYDRASRHWQKSYPQRYRTQHYEALVADPETQTRELLDFCGVEFDPACLRFHETQRDVRTASASQVREPIRKDTARAEKYGTLLDPLRRALNLPNNG
ncbi:MAG TPA: sulfotransferase [Rudaea sp.]|nr:sulfotransferase [Rudaea sp.]